VRSFAPAHGIAEDPVCGSGNLSVGVFLRENRLLERFGNAYVARQGMQLGREGRVSVRIRPNDIEIGGHAVTCVEGTLNL
jgi:PhzF family phenazine biosynthesis protein